jgi:sarcosine oxidase subunit beta
MSTGYQIGIIGGGAHGAAAAYHLARRGISSVLFEQRTVAGGPTGLSSGIVRAYYTNAFLAEVARDSMAFLAGFGAPEDTGLVRTGGLYLHGGEDVPSVLATSMRLSNLDVAHELLPVDALAARFPALDVTGVAMGVWEPGAGYADPHRTTSALAAAARRLGANLVSHAKVEKIEEERRSVRVTLADGTGYEVDRLLVAAGPWTRPLLAQVGADLPLTAERHVVAGLRQSDPVLARAFPHVLIDVAGGYYSRPQGEQEFLLGPLAPTSPTDPDHFPTRVTDAEFAGLAARTIARIPTRRTARAHTSWASLYDVSPDWQPVIGPVSERVYVDAGTSGHGFKLAPVLGDHVARLLTDEADPRLAQFSPARLITGDHLGGGFGVARILG